MSLLRDQRNLRKGSMAPLAGIFMVFLVGMVAFSVDVSWMVSTQMELQNAADAAALAGTGPLRDNYVGYLSYNQSRDTSGSILSSILTSARTAARNCAALNGAGGVTSLTLADDDIEFGYTNSSGVYSATYSGYPNTVKVKVRRDTVSNNPLRLFFAPVIGTSSSSLTASAAAAIYGGNINSFSSGAGILPYAYDVDRWISFFNTGQGPDGTTTLVGGLPALQVYPSVMDTGNFGEISLNDTHVGASTTRSWINDGLTQDDINALTASNLIPLSAHPADTWDWSGNTGFKSSDVQAVNSYSGKNYVLPLFKAYAQGTESGNSGNSSTGYQAGTGNGSHYNYNIVKFISIKIVSSTSNNRQIIVQPANSPDPNLIFDSVTPVSNTTITPYFTLADSRLVQ